MIYCFVPEEKIISLSGAMRARRKLTPYIKRKPSFMTAFRYGNCSSTGRGRVPIISRLGIPAVSSSFSLQRVSGWRRSQNITTSRTQAVVSVPAIVNTCASSESRTSPFSCSGSLLSRIETKIMGWAWPLYASLRERMQVCNLLQKGSGRKKRFPFVFTTSFPD